MAQYRRKPTLVDAFRLGTLKTAPSWWLEAIDSGVVETRTSGARIKTRDGIMQAVAGDWITRDAAGEITRWKPDIFAADFEAA
jgi:hypothetical protein